MTREPTAAIHASENASDFWVAGDRVTVRAKLDGTTLNVIDIMVPPGSGTPPHTHRSVEIFRVLEGSLMIWAVIDGVSREHEAGPGDVVTIPSNAPHCYRNASAKPVLFTAIVEDQMVAFFKEAAAKDAPSGPPAAEMISRILKLAARHQIQLLQAA